MAGIIQSLQIEQSPKLNCCHFVASILVGETDNGQMCYVCSMSSVKSTLHHPHHSVPPDNTSVDCSNGGASVLLPQVPGHPTASFNAAHIL